MKTRISATQESEAQSGRAALVSLDSRTTLCSFVRRWILAPPSAFEGISLLVTMLGVWACAFRVAQLPRLDWIRYPIFFRHLVRRDILWTEGLPRRGYRTQPGFQPWEPHNKRFALKGERCGPGFRLVKDVRLAPPFRAHRSWRRFPGLKPWAEFRSPSSGHKTKASAQGL